MIIRCDRCDTEFSLDDAQMREGGTAVRCSVCSHVFTAHPPDPRDIGHRPWQIRTEDGVLFSAKNLRVVSNWIQESRLAPNDEISRTGHRWRRLSEIPEFQRALGLTDEPGITVVSRPQAPAPEQTPVTGQSPAASGNEPELGSAGATPELAPPAVPPLATTPTVPAAPTRAPSPVPPRPAPAAPPATRRRGGTGFGRRVSKTLLGTARPDKPPAPSKADKPAVSAILPTEEESEMALDSLRAPAAKEARTPPAPPRAPRMSASLRNAVSKDGESTESEETPKPQEDRMRSGVAVSDVRSRFREIPPTPQETQAAKRKSLWIAGSFGAAAVAVMAILLWPSADPATDGAPKGAAVVQAEGEAPPKEVSASRSALQAMDPKALRTMEANLHEQMQREDLGAKARSKAKFVLVELLTERALQLSLAATLSSHDAQMLLDAARSDVRRARTLFDADPFSDVDPLRRQVAQLRLEFAEGRPLKELPRLLPASGAADTRALLQAAPLWRDAHDPVPAGLLTELDKTVQDLEQAQTPSMLLREALAVAQLRSGEQGPARRWAKARLANAISDPVAARIEDVAVRMEANPGDTSGGALGESHAAGTSTAMADAAGDSADRLLDKGCRLVERGSASAGIPILKRALEQSPDDLDILLCLAQGYARSGDQERSLVFYEQILQRSPKHRSALYGAATQAAAQGKHDRATQYYRALIEVEPGHGPAAAYLEVHGAT